MNRLSNILAALGLVLVGYCLWIEWRAHSWQEAEEKALSSPPASECRRSYPSAGNPLAVLLIPRIGLKTVVVEGTSDEQLRLAAGHVPGTALPGDEGNVAVAAHRDTFFRSLREIRIRDEITLKTGDGERRYRVVATTITTPQDTSVLSQTGRSRLTLITCYPFSFIGSAPKRFIVEADEIV